MEEEPSGQSLGPVNAPYALLARHYDTLCGYAAPINRHARERILRAVLPKVRRVCDLGCGSGETAVELAKRGLEVHAVDLSPVFCEAVEAKAPEAGVRIAVHCADMRDFSLPDSVDLVLAEFASLNNLADRRELPQVLVAVRRALVQGGWFLFDINTPLALRTQYVQTDWVEDSAFKLVQRGTLDPDQLRARLDFEWFIPSGRMWRHVRETLWHVSWSGVEIRQALRRAGFDEVRVVDGADVRPRIAQRREEPTRTTWPEP